MIESDMDAFDPSELPSNPNRDSLLLFLFIIFGVGIVLFSSFVVYKKQLPLSVSQLDIASSDFNASVSASPKPSIIPFIIPTKPRRLN